MRLPERVSPRVPVVLFSVLGLATIAAFFITQHLKVANPYYNGSPRVDPAVINPRDGGVCADAAGQHVSFRRTRVGFYLQSHSDVVDVDVFDSDGDMVAQMVGSGRYLRAARGTDQPYAFFSWNGRTSAGTDAPAGVYTLRLYLRHADRNVPITGQTITVDYSVPHPRVTSVSVGALTASPGAGSQTATATTGSSVTTSSGTTAATTAGAGTTTAATTTGSDTTTAATTTPEFTPGRQTATLHFQHGPLAGAQVVVYRASADGTITPVLRFGVNPAASSATWNGLIAGHPAPAGSYLLGLAVANAACTPGRFPLVDDPAPQSTVGAGVNVTYLTATPPLDPTPAGQRAYVGVQDGGAPFTWALRRAGTSRVLATGHARDVDGLQVRLPGIGLYTLALRSGDRRTAVPLVASGTGARAGARVLVVLPALSWQGDNATDDSSDGLIDSLANGSMISLDRPLVSGLPADVAGEAALLAALDADHLRYDLTTDVALAQGTGPGFGGRSGVLLDGAFTWLPGQIVNPLTGFVRHGGRVFAAGIDSLESVAPLLSIRAGAFAGPARAVNTDPFGVHHGTISPSYGQLIAEFTDGLGIFPTDLALQYSHYQVLQPPGSRVASAAGVSSTAPTIIGFHLGRGTVVEAGLGDFGASLAGNPQAVELLHQISDVVLR